MAILLLIFLRQVRSFELFVEALQEIRPEDQFPLTWIAFQNAVEPVHDGERLIEILQNVLSQEVSATSVEETLKVNAFLAVAQVRIVKRPRDTEGPEAHGAVA